MLNTKFIDIYNDIHESISEFGIGDDVDVIVDGETSEDKKDLQVGVSIEGKNYSYSYRIEMQSELVYKRFFKRYIKLSVYRSLCTHYNRSLPWGSLTGIRPTKLAYQSIDTLGEYENYFTKELLVSEEKTQLVKDILQAQSGIFEKNNDNCDLFASIPFCPSRCAYCSFLSCEIAREKNISAYIDTLIKEIQSAKKLVKNLRSVYIGGGTPVALKEEDFERVLDAVGSVGVEYTVEAGRPDAINSKNLSAMKEHGVTRICVNPQTFCDETLFRLGRKHTSKDIFEKYDLARTFGFDINMDLIAGLIGENFEIFKQSIEKTIELNPDNVTVHTLALKRGSILKESTDKLDGSEVGKMVDYAREQLQKAGYRPYYLYRQKYMAGNLENVGYAKPNKECVYNVDIMEEISQNIACGAHSVSKSVDNNLEKIERYGAPKDVATYVAKIDEIIEKKAELFNAIK